MSEVVHRIEWPSISFLHFISSYCGRQCVVRILRHITLNMYLRTNVIGKFIMANLSSNDISARVHFKHFGCTPKIWVIGWLVDQLFAGSAKKSVCCNFWILNTRGFKSSTHHTFELTKNTWVFFGWQNGYFTEAHASGRSGWCGRAPYDCMALWRENISGCNRPSRIPVFIYCDVHDLMHTVSHITC